MTLEDIETIVILVELKTGEAHQVIAAKEDKLLYLRLLSKEGLKITKPIERVEFKEK